MTDARPYLPPFRSGRRTITHHEVKALGHRLERRRIPVALTIVREWRNTKPHGRDAKFVEVTLDAIAPFGQVLERPERVASVLGDHAEDHRREPRTTLEDGRLRSECLLDAGLQEFGLS